METATEMMLVSVDFLLALEGKLHNVRKSLEIKQARLTKVS